MNDSHHTQLQKLSEIIKNQHSQDNTRLTITTQSKASQRYSHTNEDSSFSASETPSGFSLKSTPKFQKEKFMKPKIKKSIKTGKNDLKGNIRKISKNSISVINSNSSINIEESE